MRHALLSLVGALILSARIASPAAADDFLTVTEQNNFRITATYDETIDFFRRLEQASPYAKMTVFGQTPQGRDLHCFIVSKDKAFTPADAKKSGKVIMLVQNGIHAGEIDGKDASMILLRDILVTRERESLLDNVILLIIPIINPDGHENNSRYTRANQYGPENAGFRVTAQRYNLNRDYMKADALEMRAWLRLWTTWMPDFFIDNHVTDGHDWQYVINYTMPWHPNAAATIRQWTKELFDPYFHSRCADLGFPPFTYAFPLRNRIDGAVGTYVDIPRLSTGYTALWNRPGLLIEMHSLKEYELRVRGNHAAMVAVLELLNREAASLKDAIARADADLIGGVLDSVPIAFQPTGESTMVAVRNYPSTLDSGGVTGGKFTRWDRSRPQIDTVPYFASFRPRAQVAIPRAYLIPREWTDVIERLRWHGVEMRALAAPATLPVELYYLDSADWAEEANEGHVRVACKARRVDTTLSYPAGTVVIDPRQPAGKVAVHALEPDAPDSFLGWGFFNTVLEQKEYAEGYVIDPLADSLYAADPQIRAEFDARIAADTAFARSVQAKRDFFYKRSRFAEGGLNWYPVARLRGDIPATNPWKDDDAR
jgi:murein tripeptide amidase MpaA